MVCFGGFVCVLGGGDGDGGGGGGGGGGGCWGEIASEKILRDIFGEVAAVRT